MLASPNTPIKAVSLVSKRWRAIALPILFRHVLWSFDRWDLVFSEACTSASDTSASDAGSNPAASLPLLAFVRDNGLGRYVDSVTLIVSDRMYGQYRLAEAGNPSSSADQRSALRDLDDAYLDEDMKALLTDARARASWTSRWRQHSGRSEDDSNWLWEMLFEAMDPKRFTIIALPRMLASLLSRMLFLGDAWSFRDQCHILSLDRRTPESLAKWSPLQQAIDSAAGSELTSSGAAASHGGTSTGQRTVSSEPAASSSEQSQGASEPLGDTDKPVKTVLFTIRPWTSVLLNEGSSTRVYKTYEFFLKRPPSILGSLLGCEEAPNDEPLIPPTVRSLSYIAIFPLSSHFNTLASHLPPLDNLYLQLVPQNNILDDKEEMAHIQAGDLWMERNTCYSLVMRAMFGRGLGLAWTEDGDDEGAPQNGWETLKVFESGDAADKEAWDMAVEYVRMSGAPWKAVADGVLVRSSRGSGNHDGASSTGDEDDDWHLSPVHGPTGDFDDSDTAEFEPGSQL
jgi:hypothetical protein